MIDKEDVLKNNYIILGADGFFRIGYHDLLGLKNVRYYSKHLTNVKSIKSVLTRLFFSNKIGSTLKKLIRPIVYSYITGSDFENNKGLCVVAFSSFYDFCKEGYKEYIKRNYPQSTLILYYQDKIKVRKKDFNVDEARIVFDLIYSYDKADCDRFDLIYYPTPYSYFSIPESLDIQESDVFFCGEAKTRYPIVIEAYKKFTEQGLKCNFYLNKIPDNCPIVEGIHYNEPLSYIRYLQFLSHSRALLEVMQEGADGYTPRLWESIIYDKHLITNNTAVFSSPYYRSEYMHDLKVCEDAVLMIQPPVSYSIEEKDRLSPINFLLNIESKIN